MSEKLLSKLTSAKQTHGVSATAVLVGITTMETAMEVQVTKIRDQRKKR